MGFRGVRVERLRAPSRRLIVGYRGKTMPTGSARGEPALSRVAVQSATERTTAPPRLMRGLKGLRLFCH
jgi:hypothetical protein